MTLLLPVSWAGMAEAADWTGTWNSTFRDGQAIRELTQTGDQVEGIYRPGNGRISGTVDGATLSGSWRDDNASGDLVFILSRGGNSFLGRYGSDEHWNGVRADPDAPPPTPFTRADTPVEALKTILTTLNATYAGDGVAELIWEPLLVYQGEQGTAPAQRLRRNLLYELMNMSTFSTAWADAYLDGDRTAIAIGPIDSDWRFDLVLERGGDGL